MGRSGKENEDVDQLNRKLPQSEGNMAQLGADAEFGSVLPCGISKTLNLRALRPSELTRLLNSTPLGEVITERRLYRHRQRAGYAIGNGKRVDFYCYVAWLICQRHERQRRSILTEYEQMKLRAREQQRSRPGIINVPAILGMLERQNFRCALTGRKLSPDDAALDHIVPISRNGRHSIDNVQVLDKGVNRAKNTLTNQEFIELCHEIVAHADPRRSELHDSEK